MKKIKTPKLKLVGKPFNSLPREALSPEIKAKLINGDTGHVYKRGTYDAVYAWLCSRKNKSTCPYVIQVFVKDKTTGKYEMVCTHSDFMFLDSPLMFIGFDKKKKKHAKSKRR